MLFFRARFGIRPKKIDMNFPTYCRVTFIQTMTLKVKIPFHRVGGEPYFTIPLVSVLFFFIL